jgi:peptide/nickel transport system substrate-binding protein
MKSRTWNWLAILVMFALLGAACSPPAPQGVGPSGGGTIVVGLQAEPVTLDAQQMSDYNSTRAGRNIFDALLHFKDESTEVEPALAESWDISEDGKVYTFKLRQGVKFHDGTDFNADAVLFSYERQIDPNHPFHDTGESPTPSLHSAWWIRSRKWTTSLFASR